MDGRVDALRHRTLQAKRNSIIRVFVNGVDVTDRCEGYDDSGPAPIATLFKLDADGLKYRDRETGDPAREHVTDGVEIREEPQ